MTTSPKRRPTLRTIADLSGLAVTTVSRALGDAPDISAETKRNVRRIADQLGYVPDRAGVRLRTGRTNVIALILPSEDDALTLTSRLIASVAAGLGGTPYHLVMVPELPGQTLMDPVRYVVETRSADALILNRIQPQDPRIAYLRDRAFPFVTHGRSDWQADHAWFDYDNHAFGRVALARLADRGRRSILLIGPPRDQTYGRDMHEGVAAEARDRGIALHGEDGISSDSPREAVARAVDRALSRGADIDGLIVASPSAAMAAIAALEARGHRVGHSIDVFAKETFPVLDLFRAGILTQHEDIARAGQFLARAALAEIGRTDGPPMQHLDGPTP